MKENVINILWTGGWDSTYRMVELSQMNVTIQAIYCCDYGRRSLEKEKASMEQIREALIKREGTKAILLPIRYINMESIPVDDRITDAYNRICEKVKLGSQYEWLARLAKQYPKLEIGVEKPADEYSGCVDAINTFGRLKAEDGIIEIDENQSSEDCILLFGNFRFPIIQLTEIDMMKNIAKWGYEDIMQMIWFCHRPIDDKPCGFCRPCQQKMECGMEWLLPHKAQERYLRYKRIMHVFGGKLGEKIANVILR